VITTAALLPFPGRISSGHISSAKSALLCQSSSSWLSQLLIVLFPAVKQTLLLHNVLYCTQALVAADMLTAVMASLAELMAPQQQQLQLPRGVATDLSDLRTTLAVCAANLVQALPVHGLGDVPALSKGVCALLQHALGMPLTSTSSSSSSSSNGSSSSSSSSAPTGMLNCLEPVSSILWGLVRRCVRTCCLLH
jgi:hypothetical protein